jgi:hypothetical protein
VPVPGGAAPLFPDLVLLAPDRGRKLQVIVEIETGESVNHLEALAQWAHYGRIRAAFHLYVPSGMVEVARRLTEDNQIHVAEIWSYHVVGDEPRFTLVHRNREAISAQAKARPMPKAAAKPPVVKSVASPIVKPVVKAAPKPAAKPAAKARPAKAAAKPKAAKLKTKPSAAKAKKIAPKKKKK